MDARVQPLTPPLTPLQTRPPRAGLDAAFTLIEIALVVAIIGVLASLATTMYRDYTDRARKAQAVSDMRNMASEIDTYALMSGQLPNDLAEVGLAGTTDPWGNPYYYLRLDTAPPGKARKDKFLVPVNSDYDLYSAGPDGKTVAPFTAKHSRDDVVRAADGSFYGRAAEF